MALSLSQVGDAITVYVVSKRPDSSKLDLATSPRCFAVKNVYVRLASLLLPVHLSQSQNAETEEVRLCADG